jgi:hypothetical protein
MLGHSLKHLFRCSSPKFRDKFRELVMRLRSVSLALVVASASAFILLALTCATRSMAQGVRPTPPQPCTCSAPARPCSCPPPAQAPPASPPRTKFASTAYAPDESDEIAALSAIGRALREVADGSSYVWYRYHGHLSGVVQPTASFMDATGRICRHILVILTTGARTGRVEGIACRLPDGNWQLEG